MFSIPNTADAGFTAQAEPDSRDIDIMVAGAAGHGVIQGCAVSAQGSPDMTVAVAVGTVQIDGWRARKVAAGNVNIGAADAANPRIDLVCADATGAKQVIAGAPASAPVMPAITAGYVVLAAVYVPAADTTIAANQITDKRAVLSPLLVCSGGARRIYCDFGYVGPDWQLNAVNHIAVSGDPNAWGILELSTGVSAAGIGAITPAGSLGAFGAGGARFTMKAKTGASLSAAGERYALHLGFADNAPSLMVDGVFFRYSDNVNAGKWQCVARSNNVETVADSGVAVAASTRYLLECEVNDAANSAKYYINGALVATIVTNIPSGAGREISSYNAIEKSIGTTARTFQIDSVEIIHLPLNPY